MVVEIVINGKIELVDSKWEPRHAPEPKTKTQASDGNLGCQGPANRNGPLQEREVTQASGS